VPGRPRWDDAAGMDGIETVRELCGFARRGPGTDAERRTARWLQHRLWAAGREADLEPHWVRPHWSPAHGLHLGLAVLASLASVELPAVALGVLVLTLISYVLDVTGRFHLLRRLTTQRATQNVVSPAPAPAARPGPSGRQLRLVVMARYDAGRSGLMYAEPVRAAAARLRRLARGHGPGPAGWATLAMVVLAGCAGARLAGIEAEWLAVVQLVPTVGLTFGVAALLDTMLSGFVPAAGDNASGVAVALDLVEALDAAPPRHLAVELVLTGAGEGLALGAREHMRKLRRTTGRQDVVVLNVAACGAGRPRWWSREGPLLPLAYHPQLRAAAARAAAAEPHLEALPHVSRWPSDAFPARLRGFPAITIGCLDHRGVVPRSHRTDDLPGRVDPGAMRAALELCLVLVAELDDDLARAVAAQTAAATPETPAGSLEPARRRAWRRLGRARRRVG
jgi:hypothetical protein